MSYFQTEREPTTSVAHHCPLPEQPAFDSGITPPLSINCNRGPNSSCAPAAGADESAGSYPASLWTDNPVWSAIGFRQEQSHRFHYQMIGTNYQSRHDTKGHGSCMFTIQAFADLDDDGLYSTYSRSVDMDKFGVRSAIGMYIDHEFE